MHGSACAAATLLVVLAGCSDSFSATEKASESGPARTAAPSGPTSAPTTGPADTPVGSPEVIRGWPTTSRNRAGVYSWDNTTCAGETCIMGFVHNGYGPGHLVLHVNRVHGPTSSKGGWTPVTVAGRDGLYRQAVAVPRGYSRRDEWRVRVRGKAIVISLSTRRGARQAELDEGRALVSSMRIEPRRTRLGFRLVFTLATNDWDSG